MGSGKAWERRAVWKGSVCLKPTRPSFISPPSFPSASSDWRLPYKARAHLIAMDFFTARSILSHQTPLTKGPQTRGAAVVLPSLPPSLPPSLSPWRLVRVQRQRETRTPPPLRRQPRAQLPAPLCVSGGSSGDHSTEAEPAAGSSRRHHTGADPPPDPDPGPTRSLTHTAQSEPSDAGAEKPPPRRAISQPLCRNVDADSRAVGADSHRAASERGEPAGRVSDWRVRRTRAARLAGEYSGAGGGPGHSSSQLPVNGIRPAGGSGWIPGDRCCRCRAGPMEMSQLATGLWNSAAEKRRTRQGWAVKKQRRYSPAAWQAVGTSLRSRIDRQHNPSLPVSIPIKNGLLSPEKIAIQPCGAAYL